MSPVALRFKIYYIEDFKKVFNVLFFRFLSDPVCLPRLSSPQQNRGGTTEAKQKTNRIGKSCRSQLQSRLS